MDPGTGRLYEVVDTKTGKRRQVTVDEAQQRGLVPVTRDLSAKEAADMQIRLYSPCACGSGKNFKFCCKTK